MKKVYAIIDADYTGKEMIKASLKGEKEIIKTSINISKSLNYLRDTLIGEGFEIIFVTGDELLARKYLRNPEDMNKIIDILNKSIENIHKRFKVHFTAGLTFNIHNIYLALALAKKNRTNVFVLEHEFSDADIKDLYKCLRKFSEILSASDFPRFLKWLSFVYNMGITLEE